MVVPVSRGDMVLWAQRLMLQRRTLHICLLIAMYKGHGCDCSACSGCHEGMNPGCIGGFNDTKQHGHNNLLLCPCQLNATVGPTPFISALTAGIQPLIENVPDDFGDCTIQVPYTIDA